MADEDRLAALEARLAALAAENERLRARLDESRSTLDVTMRGQRRCRACGGRSIIFAQEIVDSDHGVNSKLGVAMKSIWTGKKKGLIEAYICAACGLMEWYVKQPGELAADGKTLHELPPLPEDPGPYR